MFSIKHHTKKKCRVNIGTALFIDLSNCLKLILRGEVKKNPEGENLQDSGE
jgi:hypothetical protein